LNRAILCHGHETAESSEMSTQPRTNPTTIETLADAVYPSFAMLAGMELDLFTPLKDGPLTVEEIARAAGTDRAKTAPLLHALLAIGLLKCDGDRFLNSPEAVQFLVRGSPDYIGMRHHAYRRRWNSVLCVAETVRAGVPARGMDYARMPVEARESFYRGTFTECLAAGRVLARSRDFSDFRSLVDVGGGSGGLAIAMAEAWPNLTITIADLPAITPVAQRYVDDARDTHRSVSNQCGQRSSWRTIRYSGDARAISSLDGRSDPQRSGQRVLCVDSGKSTLCRRLDTRRLACRSVVVCDLQFAVRQRLR
jgi:hypothetical protein